MPHSIGQATRGDRPRRSTRLGLGLVLIWTTLGSPAVADRIMLRGGGQIHGKLIIDPTDPTHLTFVGAAGKKPIIYKKEQILQVIPEKSVLDEYVVLRAKDRALAEEEFQLGVWCEDHKLKDLAENHFEAAVRLDAQYGPAHEKLGHILLNGRWLNADEQREASGQVKYRGRWMTAEEKDRLEDQAALAAENQSWLRRVKVSRDAFLAGPDARSKEAEKRLLAIREVAAVGPILRILGNDPNPAVRELAGRILGSIQGPESSAALVARLLGETDDAVREHTLSEAARREPDQILPRLVRALKSPRPDVINRAAWSLGQLNAKTAVPQLIPALTFTEYRTEMVPVGGAGGAGGGMGGGSNGVMAGDSGGGGGGVSFGSYTGSTYLGITPPVVGPGVVAYGAVGVPYGSGVSLGTGGGGIGVTSGGGIGIGGGVMGGGGGGGGGVKALPQVVAVDHPNVEVLNALVKLTGQDFGYNLPTWKRWAASFRSDPNPGRRVPEP